MFVIFHQWLRRSVWIANVKPLTYSICFLCFSLLIMRAMKEKQRFREEIVQIQNRTAYSETQPSGCRLHHYIKTEFADWSEMYPVQFIKSPPITHLIWDDWFVCCLCRLTHFDRKRSVCAISLQSFLSSEGQSQLIWLFIGIFQT